MLRPTTRVSRALGLLATLIFALAALPYLSAAAQPAAPPAAVFDSGGALIIPPGTAPKLDASCADFADVAPLSYSDLGGGVGQVFLKTSGGNLFACIQAKPGTFKDRFGAIYLDPQGDGATYEFARKNDYALRIGVPGATDPTANGSFHGTDVANGYVTDSAIVSFWNGTSAATPNGETFEFAISLGRFGVQGCQLFGIGAYHHWASAVGDDYGYPSNQFFDQPRTWQLARLDNSQCGQSGRIAYIYRGNTADATTYYNLLVGAGYSVDLIPLSAVLTTVFRAPTGTPNYDLIIVADDTGDLDRWGSTAPPPDISPDQVARIRDARLPIIGLGEGGYAFFGKLALFIGWPNGWHGPEQRVNRAAGAPAAYYNTLGDPVQVYSGPVNAVGIYLNPAPLPSDVFPIGLEDPTKDHASIIQQGCRLLWGFSGNPSAMAADGKTLFLNAVAYMHVFQCGTEPPPPSQCSVVKSSDPADGTPVTPGQIIKYTITYTNCQQVELKLVDSIPPDTIYVPGSASDGIAPGADGSLTWSVPPGSGTKSFKVRVSDTQCRNQQKVVNRAGLLIPGSLPVISNVVSHPVTCPPITLPNDQPPYAEREVQVHPYPLITGTPSAITVRLSNSSSTAQLVKVSFQTSPQRFGIGINFNTFDSQVVTIPAHSNVIVVSSFTPVSSGHYCIQIKIEDASLTPKYAPIYTQRNLDVTEDLTPGQPDTLLFKVANPTGATADIKLTVDNTCPGWTAVVNPALLGAVGPNGLDVREAALVVTPPNPATLGSGCHIDVQGWIGDTLIGGIRKLDVPPVHLPMDVEPRWMEPEISFVPNPPAPGQPAKICVQLQNPLPVIKTVTLEYAVADFGAGISFTTVATQSVTLPPNSNGTYCVSWTPDTHGTLHRCVLVTLKQPNYRDMSSQRNVDLVRVLPSQLLQIDIPLKVHNPDGVPHKLQFVPTFYGIDPLWKLRFLGDPPPDMLAPGQTLDLHIGFTQAAGLLSAATSTPSDYFGDQSRIEVAVVLDGEEVGGFTIQLESSKLNLPLVMR